MPLIRLMLAIIIFGIGFAMGESQGITRERNSPEYKKPKAAWIKEITEAVHQRVLEEMKRVKRGKG